MLGLYWVSPCSPAWPMAALLLGGNWLTFCVNAPARQKPLSFPWFLWWYLEKEVQLEFPRTSHRDLAQGTWLYQDQPLTWAAASVSPQRALDAIPTHSPKAGRSPVLAFCEIPAIDSPRTCKTNGQQHSLSRMASNQGVKEVTLQF